MMDKFIPPLPTMELHPKASLLRIRLELDRKNQCVCPNVDRVVLPGYNCDHFAYFLGSNTDGKMLPLLSIVEVTCKNPTNLVQYMVLTNLLVNRGVYPQGDRWKEHVPEGDITIYRSKNTGGMELH